MTELLFQGVVTGGVGKHASLYVPGRNEIEAPDDWPIRLELGSLNVRIDRFPPQICRVEDLDGRQFAPTFVIPRDRMRENIRGDGQVWRARVGSVEDCWVLRRIGSQVGQQLELVAGRRLRDDGLYDGQQVEVIMYGDWRS